MPCPEYTHPVPALPCGIHHILICFSSFTSALAPASRTAIPTHPFPFRFLHTLQGAVLLEFANATAGGGVSQGGGAVSRTFDWGSKLTFELYPDDLGVLLAGIAQGGVTIDRGPVNPEEVPGYEPGYVARVRRRGA